MSLEKLSEATLREHSGIMCWAWPFSNNVQNLIVSTENKLNIDAVKSLSVHEDGFIFWRCNYSDMCPIDYTHNTPGNPAMSMNAHLWAYKVQASNGTNCVTICYNRLWQCCQCLVDDPDDGGLWQTQVITAALLHFSCCQIPQCCDDFDLRWYCIVALGWRSKCISNEINHKHDSCMIQSVAFH